MKHIRSEEQCASFLIYAVHDVTRLGERLASPEILEEDSLFTQNRRTCYGFFSEFVIEGNKPFVPNNVPAMYRQDRRQISSFDARTTVAASFFMRLSI